MKWIGDSGMKKKIKRYHLYRFFLKTVSDNLANDLQRINIVQKKMHMC